MEVFSNHIWNIYTPLSIILDKRRYANVINVTGTFGASAGSIIAYGNVFIQINQPATFGLTQSSFFGTVEFINIREGIN